MVYAHTRLEINRPSRFLAERGHREDDLEPRKDGLHRRILLCDRIAEIDKQPIAHVVGNVAAEPLHDRVTGLVIGAQDIAQVLGVELLGQWGRIDEVTEHHRHLAALGRWFRRRWPRWGRDLRGGPTGGGKVGGCIGVGRVKPQGSIGKMASA